MGLIYKDELYSQTLVNQNNLILIINSPEHEYMNYYAFRSR